MSKVTDVANALTDFGARFTVETLSPGASVTLSKGYPWVRLTMTQNCTVTFPTPDSDGYGFVLEVIGAYTLTLPGGVTWPDGTPATYATRAIYSVSTSDAGTTWSIVQTGKAFA